jgi:hypothetical protein
MAIRPKALFVSLLVLAGFTPSSIYGQTFSGRLTSSLYVHERSDSTDVASTHARGYQAFQFYLGRGNIALNTYGQIDGDFSSPLVGDAKFRLYNLYLEWKNIGGRGAVKVGRQPIFAGVAVGTVDGAEIRVKAARWLRIKAFAGGLLPPHQDVDLIDNLDQNYMAGGQLAFAPARGARINLSFLNKRQRREGFTTQRSDSIGNAFDYFIHPSDRALQLTSIDVVWEVRSNTSLNSRGDYDLYGNRVTRTEIAVRSAVSTKLTLNGGYTYRSPRLPWNSIFSVFNIEENHEVEGTVYYRHDPGLRFYGEAAGIFYTSDESYRGTLGVETNHLSANYVHRGGYAGVLDGFNGSFYYPLRRGSLMPMAQLSWASYKTDSNQGDRESLFSGSARLTVRPKKEFTLDGEIQLINNPYYSSDVRFLFRLQYWFFKNLGAGS